LEVGLNRRRHVAASRFERADDEDEGRPEGRAGRNGQITAEKKLDYREPTVEAGLDAGCEAACRMDARAGLNAGFEAAVVIGSEARPSATARP